MPPSESLWEEVGARVQSYREAYEWSQVELARRAGVDRNVVGRLEAGRGCSMRSMAAIAHALYRSPTWLMRGAFLGDAPFRVHRADKGDWKPSILSKIRRRNIYDPQLLSDPAERKRLGSQGLAHSFGKILDLERPGSRLDMHLCELYSQNLMQETHPGEEVIFVLEGCVRVLIGEDCIELGKGDAMSYWADVPHGFQSPEPRSGARLLIVNCNEVLDHRPQQEHKVLPVEKIEWGARI